MQTTWILVADASQAKIFTKTQKEPELLLVKEFSHPESRLKGEKLASDRPGHYQSKGTGHGAFVERSDPKEYEIDRFAQELAEEIESGRIQHSYNRLVVVAPPHFQVLLNKHFNDNISQVIEAKVEKEYTKLNEKELLSELKNYINL